MRKGFNKKQKARLAAAGWVETTVEEFLGLSETESALIEIRLALGRAVAKRRKKNRWTQSQVAKAIGSTQSRVALVEQADPEVSADLILKALIATGVKSRDITKALTQSVST
jgi:predicted XRE-type DNA-binding protein